MLGTLQPRSSQLFKSRRSFGLSVQLLFSSLFCAASLYVKAKRLFFAVTVLSQIIGVLFLPLFSPGAWLSHNSVQAAESSAQEDGPPSDSLLLLLQDQEQHS